MNPFLKSVVVSLLALAGLPSRSSADRADVAFGLPVFDQLAALDLTDSQQAAVHRLRTQYEPSLQRLQQRAALPADQREARSAAVRTAIARGLRGIAARNLIETSGRLTADQIAAERQLAQQQIELSESVRRLLTAQQLDQLANQPPGGDESGDFVLRLSPRLRQPSDDAQTLLTVASELQLTDLASLLRELNIRDTERIVPGITRAELDDPNLTPQIAQLKSRLRSYWRVSLGQRAEPLPQIIKRFNQLPEIDLAYKAFRFSDPTVDPSDDVYCVQQGYLNSAPEGIDARYAWTQINGQGAATGLVDVERGWYPRHEDYASKRPLLIHGGLRPASQRHGTAVLGEAIADDNHVGVVGIAPSADYVFLSSYFNDATMTDGSVPAAIYWALPFLATGDVLLLEVQERDRCLPAEVDDAVFDAVRLSVLLGVTVVAAGGNGGEDLDAYRNLLGQRILLRGSADFRDSGAILVGAADSCVPHNRTDWSNYGSRLDCYAWGRRVVSTGHRGDLDDGGGDVNRAYTNSFNGTSSAAPVIAGAALLLQGLAKGNARRTLLPGQLRDILSNPATGTAQGPSVPGHIGVLPNLRAIIAATPCLPTPPRFHDRRFRARWRFRRSE